MIRSSVLNSALLTLGVFLLILALGYGREAANDPYYGGLAVFHSLLGAWCIAGAIINLRQRRQAPRRPTTVAERDAVGVAVGILASLALFILLVVLDQRFGYNISANLLVALAGVAVWLAFLAVPVMIWVRVSSRPGTNA